MICQHCRKFKKQQALVFWSIFQKNFKLKVFKKNKILTNLSCTRMMPFDNIA